jgi:hypothetical protein
MSINNIFCLPGDGWSLKPLTLPCGLRQDFNTKYLAATMAVVLIIGPFFSGHLKPGEGTKGRAAMLTNMRYHTSVIISLFTALGTLAESSRRIMKLGAFSDRIAELEDVAKEISSGQPFLLLPAHKVHDPRVL